MGVEVDLDRGAGSHRRRVGRQGLDEGPYEGGSADSGGRARGDVKEIAPCRLSDMSGGLGHLALQH